MAGRKLCVLGVMLGVLCLASFASGQYVGDNACAVCHPDMYSSYMNTGHPWMLVKTDGEDPPVINYPTGAGLPTLPDGVEWSDVNYIFGNFNGHGYAVDVNGIVLGRGSSYSGCVKCHATGYDPAGSTDNIAGTWAQEGIRCEACHGPAGHGATLDEADLACMNCHYGGTDVDRIDYNPTTMAFGHHPQGEQFIRSVHQSRACSLCHDPHKSVWQEDAGAVQHCGKDCHARQKVNGYMGEILDCEDCHMPQGAHIWQITDEPISSLENSYVDEADGKTYMKVDAENNAYMTLDLVCAGCHQNMTLEEFAAYAPRIHAPPPVDLTVNNADDQLILAKADTASVDITVDPTPEQEGAPADWYLTALTPWGWYHLDFVKGWVPGFKPSLTNYPVVTVRDPERSYRPYNLLRSPLLPGMYVFVTAVFADDGSFAGVDYVPVFITP